MGTKKRVLTLRKVSSVICCHRGWNSLRELCCSGESQGLLGRKASRTNPPRSNGLGSGTRSFLQVPQSRLVCRDGHGSGLRIRVTRRTLAQWGSCCWGLTRLEPCRPEGQGRWLMAKCSLHMAAAEVRVAKEALAMEVARSSQCTGDRKAAAAAYSPASLLLVPACADQAPGPGED